MSKNRANTTAVQKAINGLFVEFKDNLDNLIDHWTPQSAPKIQGKPVEYPLIDLIENEDTYVIEAELPGVEKKHIFVEIAADIVRIRGSINLGRPGDTDNSVYLVKERRDQDFNKEIILPRVVNPKGGTAFLDEGILKIVLPKSEPDTLEWNRIVVKENS
jgi:HSP20 family molecular chaperone IbpA